MAYQAGMILGRRGYRSLYEFLIVSSATPVATDISAGSISQLERVYSCFLKRNAHETDLEAVSCHRKAVLLCR